MNIYLIVLCGYILIGCNDDNSKAVSNLNNFQDKRQESSLPSCPKNHTDSIIPILYGMPSEESFQKADSGLIFLGGCELSSELWYCNIHQISF